MKEDQIRLPFCKLTTLISILLGIVLPVVLGVKDPVYIAISFTVVWFIYSIILFGYVFLIEGRRNRNQQKVGGGEGSYSPPSIQEWGAGQSGSQGKYLAS